jgi:hypothetical protein
VATTSLQCICSVVSRSMYRQSSNGPNWLAIGVMQGQPGTRRPPVSSILAGSRAALRFANFLTLPAARSSTSRRVLYAITLVTTLTDLVWASGSGGVANGVVGLVGWVGVAIAGVVLGDWTPVLGAVVLLAVLLLLGAASGLLGRSAARHRGGRSLRSGRVRGFILVAS